MVGFQVKIQILQTIIHHLLLMMLLVLNLANFVWIRRSAAPACAKRTMLPMKKFAVGQQLKLNQLRRSHLMLQLALNMVNLVWTKKSAALAFAKLSLEKKFAVGHQLTRLNQLAFHLAGPASWRRTRVAMDCVRRKRRTWR